MVTSTEVRPSFFARSPWFSWPDPLLHGGRALTILALVILETALEAAYVQITTTRSFITAADILAPSFVLLFCLDLLVPLTVALLSKRLFLLYLGLDCLQNIILLHYDIFFYNPLTLSTIFHSIQGAASLGIDIFAFARWEIIAACGCLCAVKVMLVSRISVPPLLHARKFRLGLVLCCLISILALSTAIYANTGLSALGTVAGKDAAPEGRLDPGAPEAVRSIGYLATWIGELRSGAYRDTELIYAELRCPDPETSPNHADEGSWQGLPVPEAADTIVFIQVESLDFSALNMMVNGHTVLPFIDHLAEESLVIKAFAPHKVGSSNSDYELLNRRVADQNVMYYSYILQYPDSVGHVLAEKGYRPAVFHGLGGNLFNLRSAYAAQGFEEFYFKEEMLAAGYAPSKFIMEHVVDEDLFALAAERMPESGPQAQFIITMTSHIPFIAPMPIFESAGGAFARYVSSLRYLDQCLAAYYAQLPEGTLLVIWGDHGSDVPYPKGFPDNARHVPFIVHVKGRTDWMDVQAGPAASERPKGTDKLSLLYVHKEETTRLACPKVYTLCELGHFLRRMALKARPVVDPLPAR